MAIASLFQLHQWTLLTTLWEPGKSTQRTCFLGYLLSCVHLPKTIGTAPGVLAWATQCPCLLTAFSYDLVNFPASCFTVNYPMTPCQSMRTLPRNRLYSHSNAQDRRAESRQRREIPAYVSVSPVLSWAALAGRFAPCGILGSLSVKCRPVMTTHSTLESKSRHPQCFWSTTNFLFPIQGKIDVSLSATASKLDMLKLPQGNDYMDGHFLKTNVPLGYW